MRKSDTAVLAKMIENTAAIAEHLAFKMFQKDNPDASMSDFDASADRSRYIEYANVAVLELVAPD